MRLLRQIPQRSLRMSLVETSVTTADNRKELFRLYNAELSAGMWAWQCDSVNSL